MFRCRHSRFAERLYHFPAQYLGCYGANFDAQCLGFHGVHAPIKTVPIHPIKLYHDKKSGYSYLYIFGHRGETGDVKSTESYLAKYIFLNGKFIKRIIIPWRVLMAYDWYCDGFIGF